MKIVVLGLNESWWQGAELLDLGSSEVWVLAGVEAHSNLGSPGWAVCVPVLGLIQMERGLVKLSHGVAKVEREPRASYAPRLEKTRVTPRRCRELSDPRFHLLRRFQEMLLNLSKLPTALL